MAIEAELHDGRILEFPDGTDPAVIQATVKRVLAQDAQRNAPEGSWLGDIARSFGQGAVGGLGAGVAAFGADTAPAQYLQQTATEIGQGLSAERQAELQRQAERMKAAEASGSTLEEVKAGLQNVAEAPLQSAAQVLGSIVPVVLAIPLTKLGLGATAVYATWGALQGAGAAKQSIYDAVRDAELADGKTEAEADAAATKAQSYIGQNFDQIAASTGLGAAAGATGLERLLPGSSRAAAGAVQQALAKRIGARAAGALATGAAEAPLEGLQGAQERLAANLALQRTGRDVGTFTGVAGQGAQEALMGGMGGAAVGAALRGPAPVPTAEGEKEPPVSPTDFEQRVREQLAEQERLASDEYLLDLKTRRDEALEETQRLRANVPAEGTPGFAEARDALNAHIANSKPVIDEYNDKEKAITGAMRRTGAVPVAEAPEETFAPGEPVVPEPALRKKAAAPAAPEAPPPVPAPQLSERLTKMDQNWLGTTNGQKFIETLQNLTPDEQEAMRVELERSGINSYRKRVFNAYFGSVADAIAASDVRSEQAAGRPDAESGLGAPSGSMGEPGTEVTSAERGAAPDTAGVGAGGADTAAESRRAGEERAALTLEKINALTADLTAKIATMGRRPRKEGPEMEAWRAAHTELGRLNDLRDALIAQPETDLGTQAAETVETETQGQAAPVAGEPAAGGQPTAGAAAEPVEAAGVTEEAAPTRTSGEILTDLELALREHRALSGDRDALLDVNGNPPAEGSRLRGRWQEVTGRMQELEARAMALADERNTAMKFEAQTRAAEPAVEEAAPAAEEAPVETMNLKDFADDSNTKAGKERDLAELQSALDIYNEPAENDTALARERQHRRAVMAVRFIAGSAEPTARSGASKEVIAAAKKMLADDIDPRDLKLARETNYRLTEGGVGMDAADIQALWDRIVVNSGWENVPNVKIIQSETQLPIRIFRQMVRDKVVGLVPGLFDNGTVYLIADNIASPHDAALTIAHEVTGHYGLQGMLGADYTDTMLAIHRGNVKVREAADALREARPSLSVATSVEEVLAEMQEAPTAHPTIRRLFNKIKDFLAKITGLETDAFTDAQVQNILWQARVWVRRGERPTTQWVKTAMFRTPKSQDFAAMVGRSELMVGTPAPVKRAAASFMQAFTEQQGVSAIDRFRLAVADNMAAVDTQLNVLFDGAVRTKSGLLNPMGSLRQAADAMQLLLPFMREGTLTYDQTTGTYRADAVKDQPSMESVLNKVKAWGETNGHGYDKASAIISKMLEAQRLDALRKWNAAEKAKDPKAKVVPIHRLVQKDKRSPDEQIDLALAEYAADTEVQQIKADLDKIKNHLVGHMERVGRISSEEAQQWRDALEYVPFDRVKDLDEKGKFVVRRKTGKGLSQLGNLPELIGTYEREVGNVFDNSVRLQGWMISQVLRQDAVSRTLKLMRAMGSATYHGKSEDAVKDPSTKVQTFERGVPVYYSMNNRYLALAFSEPSVPTGPIAGLMQGFANILRKSITAMPPFAVTQLVKDLYRAFAQSGVQNPYALMFPAIRTFVRVGYAEIMGRKHPLLEKINRLGIGGGYDIDFRDPSAGAMQELGLRARGRFETVIHKLDAITRSSDVAVRIAIHERTMAETGDALLAATRAREFINFRRHGAGRAMPALIATIPFLNAYIQGMDVLYRQATGRGASSGLPKAAAQKMFASRMLQLAGMTALYSLAVGGTEDYEELDALTKANNFIIPGTSIKIPVAGEIGALVKVPVEAVFSYFRHQGTPDQREAAELTSSVIKYAFDQYSMGAYPAALKPLLENITNYSFFTGRALEGTYQQTLDPAQRIGRNTSELAMAISKVGEAMFGPDMTTSPIKIDNFLRGYFGSVATTVMMATDQIINPDRLDRPMNKYWMLSVFMYDRDRKSADKDDAYAWNEKAGRRLATFRNMADRDPDSAMKYYDAHEDEIVLGTALEEIFKDAGEIRRYINDLNSSEVLIQSMTKEERQAEIKAAQELEQEIFGQLRELRGGLRQ